MNKLVTIGASSFIGTLAVMYAGLAYYQHTHWPQPTPATRDITPERKASRHFARIAYNNIRSRGDLGMFKCLALLPYELPVSEECGPRAVFDARNPNYILNAKLIPSAAEEKYFDTPALRDAFQLFVTAHEYNHYLNFKAHLYQFTKATPAAQQNALLSKDEYSSDLFGIAVVRPYLPEHANLFERRLLAWRQEEAIMTKNEVHAGMTTTYYAPVDALPPAGRNIPSLTLYTSALAFSGENTWRLRGPVDQPPYQVTLRGSVGPTLRR